jgi:hypothetical protein
MLPRLLGHPVVVDSILRRPFIIQGAWTSTIKQQPCRNGNTPQQQDSSGEVAFNLGGICKLREHVNLLFTADRFFLAMLA